MDIAQAIRAQLTSQLIEALSSGAARTAAAALAGALKQGQSLAATVVGETAPDQVALRLQGQLIVADIRSAALPAAARQSGATLSLTVETAGPTPRLSLAGFTPPQASTPDAQRAPSGTVLPEPAVTLVSRTDAKAAASPNLAVTPQQAALKDAVAAAAARQGSAAPLYANLASLLSNGAAPLPEPVRQIAALLLANRLDAEAPITPDVVKQAFAGAGIPFPAPTQTGSAPPSETKALLAALKAILPAPEPRDNAQTPPRFPRSRLPQSGFERLHMDLPPPEPPRRDSALAAQKPLPPTIPPDAEPQTVAAVLARETEQAIERSKLLQIASLPDQRQPGEAARPQQITVELPIALGQQTAMAGVRIERDPRRGRDRAGDPVDVWGIRFAIETDEIGAVHAHLRLAGERLGVSIWANDPLTHRAFVDAVPRLEASLRDAALDIEEIVLFSGRPHEPKRGTAGHFLDVAS